MRLLELQLRAVGPFTDTMLDVSRGDQGLHLIYGPNEAGKSSALRALRYLLFGFPHQIGDDFLHPYRSLRVGAIIADDQGRQLEFLRRKANARTLRGPDDSTDLGDDALRPFLGTVGEYLFNTFFGISHADLVEGGRTILAGEGGLGEVLFSGARVGELHTVVKQLEAECSELFLAGPRAKKQLNVLLRDLEEQRKTVRECQLPAREWEELQTEFEKSRRHKAGLDTDLERLGCEKSRLERLREAQPLAAKRRQVLTELAGVQDAVSLPDDFRDRRQQTESNLRLAEQARGQAKRAVEELDYEIAAINLPQALLDQRKTIEPFSQRLGVYQQARADRPELEGGARQAEADAIATLRKLGHDLDLSRASELVIPSAERTRIAALGNRYQGIVEAVDRVQEQLTELDRRAEELQTELHGLPAARDTSGLQEAVRSSLKLEDAEAECLDTESDLNELERQLAVDLGRLRLWTGTAEELEALPVPSAETIERFHGEFAQLELKQQDLRRRADEQQAELDKLISRMEELRRERRPPSESDLDESRAIRERAWRLVRRQCHHQAIDDADLRSLLEVSVGLAAPMAAPDLTETYERLVRAADEVADRLRREAEAVARSAQFEAGIETCRGRLERVAADERRREQDWQRQIEDWREQWRPAGVEPLTPREMLAWLRQFEQLRDNIGQARRLRERNAALRRRLDEHRTRLTGQLRVFGQDAPAEASLSQLLAAGQRAVDAGREVDKRRSQVERDIQQCQRDRTRAQIQAAEARERLDAWQREWLAAIGRLPLDPAAGPDEAGAVLEDLNQLSVQLKEAEHFRHRLREIDDSCRAFETDVRGLVDRVADDLANLPIEQAAAGLIERLATAVADDNRRRKTLEKRDREDDRLAAASSDIERFQAELEALCREACCASPDGLRPAEDRSARRKELEGKLGTLEQRLLDLSGGLSLDEFVEQAAATDPDTLVPQIERLDAELRAARDAFENATKAVGGLEVRLAQLDSSGRAADAADQAQDLLARLRIGAEDYARLKLALTVLRKGIERYRERNQGPVLKHASAIFAKLTCESFAELREEYDTDGRPELVGVRSASGRVVRLAEMSDGTADQIYLAVRLAWLKIFLEQHESFPFIIDDVLIRFDPERSAAALDVLAELSRRTQVLFFTHHRHLVDLARERLDADMLFTHELSGVTAHAVPA